MRVSIQIEQLPHGEGLPLPSYQTAGSAGVDLCAALESSVTLQPFERALIPTGLKLAIPPGYEAQLRPRSGLALRQGLTVLNSPGTIDSDYRGEIGVILINLGQEPCELSRGMRVAQLVVAPVARAAWERVAALGPTARGQGGFGHTGA